MDYKQLVATAVADATDGQVTASDIYEKKLKYRKHPKMVI